MDFDAQFLDRIGLPAKASHRQRVQHLVRENDTVEGLFRRPIEPPHAVKQLRQLLRQMLALTLTQVGTHFENPIVFRQLV